MYEYKVLVVDDEAASIDMICHLLHKMTKDFALDIYTARSTTEAIHYLQSGRMDLVITDIEMPGRNGLELISYIRSRWNMCRIVILTAFSQFSYAYDAIQMQTDGYLLKTESDTEIIRKLTAIIESINEDIVTSALYAKKKMKSIRLPPEGQTGDLLLDLLTIPQQQEALRQLGFRSHNVLVLIARGHAPQMPTVLHELLGHYLRSSTQNIELVLHDENRLVWLLELSSREMEPISGTLELVQNACLNAFSMSLSFVLGFCDCARDQLSDVYASALTALENRGDASFIYQLGKAPVEASDARNISDVTLQWLCNYIDSHLSGDLSLVTLSTLTGYNPQYLSGLFRQKLDTTLSRYIANKRLAIAKEMLADIKIPIQDIVSLCGFSSHSYFSRFIRKETNLSPQELRMRLIGSSED